MRLENNNIHTFKPIQNPSFEALKFKNIGKMKVFEDFPIKLKSGETKTDCFVRANSDEDRFYIDIENQAGRRLGISTSNTLNEKGTLYNNTIENLHRELPIQGIGSTMRLGQIIVLLENPNLNKIKFFSMGNAVFFHAKFNFRPAITKIGELSNKLEDIAAHTNDKRFEANVKEAKQFLEYNKFEKKLHIKEGNNILNSYLQNILKNNLQNDPKFKIYSGFDMELSKKDILENKDFYNSLFQKYGIDYQIQ